MFAKISLVEIFNNINDGGEKTSIFQLLDNYISSLGNDLNSGNSSNLLSYGETVDLVFPSSGAEADFQFILNTKDKTHKIEATIYGNDYSRIVNRINELTTDTGISASLIGRNRIEVRGLTGSTKYQQFQCVKF